MRGRAKCNNNLLQMCILFEHILTVGRIVKCLNLRRKSVKSICYHWVIQSPLKYSIDIRYRIIDKNMSVATSVARYCNILHWCNTFMLAINILHTLLYCIVMVGCNIIIKSCLFSVILFGNNRKCNIESPWALQQTFITNLLLLCRIRHHVL